jgi:hypothetical protein
LSINGVVRSVDVGGLAFRGEEGREKRLCPSSVSTRQCKIITTPAAGDAQGNLKIQLYQFIDFSSMMMRSYAAGRFRFFGFRADAEIWRH